MKKLILAAVLIAPMLAQAAQTKLQYCGTVAILANSVMNARQSGVPLKNLIENATLEFAYDLMMRAYTHPQFSTFDYQQKSNYIF